MICDQQNIDENNFCLNALPEYVNVIFIKRKILRNTLYQGYKGHILKLLANFNIPLSARYQKKLAIKIFNKTFKLSLQTHQLASADLFLFNDRNKISRLFRLAFNKYSIIEEGFGNYRGFKLKKIESFFNFLLNKNKNLRYFGDSLNCENIYLLSPNEAPKYIRSKAKKIDFINDVLINKYCLNFFKYKPTKHHQAIIATQPLQSTGIDLIAYKGVVKKLVEKNISVALKPHPSEDITRYQTNFNGVDIIDGKIPLELIIFGSKSKTSIISLFSSAGMGFENYCNRYNLVNTNELSSLDQLFSKWKNDHNLIIKRINEVI